MNDDLTERAFAPRRSLITIAALIVALKNFDHDGTNGLTVNSSDSIHSTDEFERQSTERQPNK